MTDRSLVAPQDLPQGDAQRVERQAAEVGVPTQTSQLGPTPAVVPGAAPGVAPPVVAPRAPDPAFDVFQGREPTVPTFPEVQPPDRYQVMMEAMAQSENVFYRNVARLMREGEADDRRSQPGTDTGA